MIPLRLIIHNFRAIEHADIDLSAVSLAAIAGRNGAGKSSAFTLAPRFALFGDVISGVSLDDLVRRGAQEMSVEFWFEHQGDAYRAIRTRSTKGKGKSTLELQQRINDQWESRSAEKIVDTEAVIESLLNLDDETFTASSMILQGQANAFTGATAGKRKEILSQILGLNVYPELQERARQKAAAMNIEIEKAKDKLLTLDERLADRPAKAETLRYAEGRHTDTLELIAKEEACLKLAESQIATLDGKRARIQQIDREITAIREEIAALEGERTIQSDRLERADKILANEAAILAKSAELDQLKQKLAALEARKPELDRLQFDLTTTQTDFYQLEDDLRRIIGRITVLQQQLAGRGTLRQQAVEYETEMQKLRDYEEKADKWNLLAAEIADLSGKKDKEESRLALEELRLSDKITTLEQQELHIQDNGCLPTCKFQQAAAAAVAELPDLRQRLAVLDRTGVDSFITSITAKQGEQQALEYDYAVHRVCKVRVDELREASNAYSQLAGKDELLQQLEQQKVEKTEQMEAMRLRWDSLQQQMIELESALEPLSELSAKVADLERWARLKDQISAAREMSVYAGERIAAIGRDIAVKQARRDEMSVERSGLELDTLDYDRLHQELAQANTQMQHLRQELATLAEQIGGMKAVLAALETDQQERDQISDEMEPKALSWTRYQTLIKAFGRDGIPALIIENAVPQLERIANEILGQMSKGKHYVRFETQRELKSRAGVSETLDIMIGDWTAERPYETFSGGEQLRIDYAIRFALAELLAQRAGSKVEWLTIDEGLGSQDAEHRALVLESIKSVASRFKRVLVITHIEDAQTAFDQIIRFDNADGGVEVLVA
ncbi:SMC family ATPase [Paenibacillus sp. PL2-23]|uniref:SMC family ATPase n=1 Tax=Paenibacillus sp. PL2-23 TaxID=2100729 RepID=UPI0030F64989